MIEFPKEIVEMYKDFKPVYLKVYRIIKDSLFTGQIPFGEKFTEEGVANALGISRTPVRTALACLRDEGILQNVTKNNLGIRGYSRKEKSDLLFLDELLEGKAAFLAAKRGITSEELSTLEELNEAISSYKDISKLSEMMKRYGVRDLHLQFHLMIGKLSGNHFLYKEIVEIRNIMRMLKSEIPYQEKYRENYAKVVYPMHCRLIESIWNRNAEDAEIAMRYEIGNAKEIYLESEIDTGYQQR